MCQNIKNEFYESLMNSFDLYVKPDGFNIACSVNFNGWIIA